MTTYAQHLVFVVPVLFWIVPAAAQDERKPLGHQAVVHFTFLEENGAAQDSATAGNGPDQGSLMNEPVRVPSPFWNQSGKKALQLDAARQQFVEIADSPDVSAPVGVTVAMLLVNLTEPADTAYHGIFAKRGNSDGKFSANYGINFQMSTDNFQVYIHDGVDYRVASYSSKAALPFRKLAYLTATFTAGDAPGEQDPDTDADDFRIQYFLNGEALVPKAVTRGLVQGSEAWTLDVTLAGIVNRLPLTIGRSEVNGEYTSCVVGDFRLFPRAFSSDEVKQLFLEVAGPDVQDLIRADQFVPTPVPVITSLSQPGVQTGQTTRLSIDGTNLGPDSVVICPFPDVRFDVDAASTANHLIVNAFVPPETVPGLYPLWVKSRTGLSQSVVFAIDRLPQRPMVGANEQQAELPAAFYGTLSGGQQQVLSIAGKKGQRLVADVELKRLGGAANPVIEIKSPAGAPLAIGWGENSLRRDARAETVLPADGIYSVELHDLAFNAPGTSAFRLKVGDLKLVDGILPAAATFGVIDAEPVGTGFSAETRLTGQFLRQDESDIALLSLSGDVNIDGSLPSVSLSRGTEVMELPASRDSVPQLVDARFTTLSTNSVAISGRIGVKGEHDRYLLNVAGEKHLKFTLQTDSLGSTLEGEIQVLDDKGMKLLAQTSDQPSFADPVLDFVIPAEVNQIQIQISDLYRRGDRRAFYRLVIEPANQPRFSLTLNTPTVNLPEDGSSLVELLTTRAGYHGPIQLSVVGDESVKIVPDQIPAGQQGKTMVRLVRSAANPPSRPSLLRIVGQSVDLNPAIKHTAHLPASPLVRSFSDTMAVGIMPRAGINVELQQLPPVLYRGMTVPLKVIVQRQPDLPSASAPIRFSLESTEPVRRRDPNNPAAGNFPLVNIGPAIVLPTEPELATINLTVPLDEVEPSIDFALRAEATPHAYSYRVIATAFTQPFHAEIKTAVSPKLEETTLSFAGEVDHKIVGHLQRVAGFNEPVEVSLSGLPSGYTGQTSPVAAGEDRFEIEIRGPKVTDAMAVPNVKLRTTIGGHLIAPESPVALTVKP